jgi:hypothetical protein
LDDLHRLISGAIINNRKAETHLNRVWERGNDLRGIVGRRDEVDVVAPYFHEFDHSASHLGRGNTLTPSQVADVVILTEDAAEVAMGEENGSRPVISHQRTLLPEMGKGARDHELRTSAAISDLSIQTVNPTLSRAEPTFFQEILKKPDPLAKLTVFKERNVGWDKTHSFSSFERIHSSSIINYYKILWNPIEVAGKAFLGEVSSSHSSTV